MSEEKITLRVADLIEDFSLYPRRQVDGSNVRDLVEAIRTGGYLPPIVVEKGTNRIVDGFHRSRAYAREKGLDHEVEVLARTYADEGELFADAVRLNRSHGRKLNSDDKIRAVMRLSDFGYAEIQIKAIVQISEPLDLTATRVAIKEDGSPVALKGGDGHLNGQVITDHQVEVLSHRLGVPYKRLAQQIIDGIEANLLPEDDSTWVTLTHLHTTLGAALSQRG